MIHGFIIRFKSSDLGTLSKFLLFDNNGNKFECYTIELPWLDNKPNYSCIPKGEYTCVYKLSNKFGQVYHVLDVPNRTAILIHPGNVAGNRLKGYKSHSWGCILPGKNIGTLWHQDAVLNSRYTVLRIMEFTQRQPIKLIIQGVVG